MRRRQAGTALMAAVLFSTTLLALSASILVSGVAMRQEQRYLRAAQLAEEAAESGVHRAVALLNEAGPSLPLGTYADVLAGGGARAKRASVTITTLETDGADNDLDGDFDEPDEAELVEVACTGSSDNVSRTLRVTLRTLWNEPQLSSPVRLAEPGAVVYASGSSFSVSGVDADLDRGPTGALYPAVGVEGDPAAIETRLLALLGRDKYETGFLGTPRLRQEEPLDIEQYVEDAIQAAEVLLHTYTPDRDGRVHPGSPGEWGTVGDPRIVYSEGSVSVGSGKSGAGLLIVDGDLLIEGGFEWVGVIIVRGGMRMSGGGSGLRLLGAAHVYGSPVAPLQSVLDLMARGRLSAKDALGVDFYVAGSVDLHYSREAVELVLRMTRRLGVSRRRFTPMQWRRGDTEDAS